jgi:hypothetical protein
MLQLKLVKCFPVMMYTYTYRRARIFGTADVAAQTGQMLLGDEIMFEIRFVKTDE